MSVPCLVSCYQLLDVTPTARLPHLSVMVWCFELRQRLDWRITQMGRGGHLASTRSHQSHLEHPECKPQNTALNVYNRHEQYPCEHSSQPVSSFQTIPHTRVNLQREKTSYPLV